MRKKCFRMRQVFICFHKEADEADLDQPAEICWVWGRTIGLILKHFKLIRQKKKKKKGKKQSKAKKSNKGSKSLKKAADKKKQAAAEQRAADMAKQAADKKAAADALAAKKVSEKAWESFVSYQKQL